MYSQIIVISYRFDSLKQCPQCVLLKRFDLQMAGNTTFYQRFIIKIQHQNFTSDIQMFQDQAVNQKQRTVRNNKKQQIYLKGKNFK